MDRIKAEKCKQSDRLADEAFEELEKTRVKLCVTQHYWYGTWKAESLRIHRTDTEAGAGAARKVQ